MRFTLALAALALSTVAFSQTIGPDSAFQVRYAANLNIGDSVVNMTNSGSSLEENDPDSDNGILCANVYTFDPAEEMISCCSCSITANALQSLSVRNSLISNTLTAAVPTSVVIKIVATSDDICNAAAATDLAPGLRVWGTTLHALPTSPVSYGLTETAFTPGGLVATELAHLNAFCGFIQADASGFGICKGCAAGGLGASTSGR